VIFTRKETCPLITLRIPQAEDAKYLGLYFIDYWRKLIGENIYLSSENNLDFNCNEKCIDYSAVNHNIYVLLKTNCYYTRQSSNLFGLITSNCEAQPTM
jgi:hypothetical protein